MAPFTEMMDEKGFMKSLIESIPCGLLVVDSDRRVRAANDVLERTFGITMGEAINKRGGEALRESGGNKAKAARILGVGRTTLYRFLADFPTNHHEGHEETRSQ